MVDSGKYRDERLSRGGIVYSKGEGENAIISVHEQVGRDRILRAGREFPVAVRASGSGFSRVVNSGITNVRVISTALRIVSKSAEKGLPKSQVSAVRARYRRVATERGWEYYSDGTVLVPETGLIFLKVRLKYLLQQ